MATAGVHPVIVSIGGGGSFLSTVEPDLEHNRNEELERNADAEPVAPGRISIGEYREHGYLATVLILLPFHG